MYRKASFLAVILLFFIMINPAYALVTSFSLQQDVYTDDERIVFVGTESEGSQPINVAIYNPNGKFLDMLGHPKSDTDGSFETIPRLVDSIFTTVGVYTATGFTLKIENGTTLLLNYDGSRVSVIPDIVLELKKVGNKSVNEKENLSFTVTATDSSIEDLEFKLDQNPPAGATIDSKTGVFSWTPTESQGPASYIFDIVILKGPSEDRETITVTVSESSVSTPPPEPTPIKNIPDFVDPKLGAQYYLDRYNNEVAYKDWFDTNYPDYTIQEAIELAIPNAFPETSSNVPNFVDPKLGAQYYLDRYNNEVAYKDWFDTNYPDYTIQEAIELAIPDAFPEPEPPKQLAPFVDPNQDPQYYIDRYNNEASYKDWFDENFPDQTIYEAVGVEPPKIGICGTGTKFVNGVCVVTNQSGGGGCLIATAAYGSEMASQVQFLREMRDNTVLATDSGNSFMGTFNSFYYSFSPTIADWERQSPIFKNIVQTTITPLLTTLTILNTVDIDSEEEMLGYGIGIILLNLGIYFAAPTFAVIKLRKYLNN